MSDLESKHNKRLILVELNEINFELVDSYVRDKPGKYLAMEHCLANMVTTESEAEYQNLEPWIQWPSVHTGLTFSEHGIFRLGDVVETEHPQIFEQVEQAGYSVGVLSAMNASNKLNKAAFFIPDPWTKTPTDGSFWSRAISSAVSQAVNDNASQRITLLSAFTLLLAIARFARPVNYAKYLSLALRSRRAPWRKALFLDLFLHDFYMNRIKARKPAFSAAFFNAGAHIQHHYFFNSKHLNKNPGVENPDWYVQGDVDPIEEMIAVYDSILSDLLRLENIELIVATGLSQKPYDRVKYYYRLKNHGDFLEKLNIRYKSVSPRMTRDFLLDFDTEGEALQAQQQLQSIYVKADGHLLFADIDNRGKSLFVTLTYPCEVAADTKIVVNESELALLPHVAFVAIKNGMHQNTGYAYFSRGLGDIAPAGGKHVKEINSTIRHFFGLTA